MEQRAMPTVDFFGHRVSRLIMGSNPFNGGSHIGPEMDAEMDSYYTIENIKKALRYGQTCGINWTPNDKNSWIKFPGLEHMKLNLKRWRG